ncbi:GPI mannosyltransferase 1 [Toxocara canis]|uniref:GPI alpha-1,4-mannosyltransferase I, catalytic subunit n=1 Tax=Toxocara canis TaxID=6265 RepID=A0A0B2W129_TOXCA|nr:GPI mannosyltransferase 1 [Toxocara canis]
MRKRGRNGKRNGERSSASEDECSSEEEVVAWTINKIFMTAFLFRALLVTYGPIHDYLFEVSFTDIDYKVFSDAAAQVGRGDSPYQRATYRYTPLLAWLLVPNTVWPEFGKMLFCTLDVTVGYLCFKTATSELLMRSSSNIARLQMTRRAKHCVIIFWLANPLTAVISARGNADVVVCTAVVCTLWLLLSNHWLLAAVVHGFFAIQLKIYPLIYMPSVFLYVSNARIAIGYWDYWRKLVFNWRGFVFVLLSSMSFAVSVALYYCMYGNRYLDESLMYHISRIDTRHNFSPYFYPLYLSDGETTLSQLIGLGAFVPQAALIIFLSFRFYDDLPFCWMLITIAFVAFNKVCTSQYFVWFICLAPIAQRTVEMSAKRVTMLMLMWMGAQVAWLQPAYLFEFKGVDTFAFIWLASLLFFAINVVIIVQLILHHNDSFVSGRKIYDPPRYMSCSEAAKQLIEIAERKQKTGIQPAYSGETPCVGLARVGWENQKIVLCTLSKMVTTDMGEPVHSLVIPGEMHPMEMDMLKTFSAC